MASDAAVDRQTRVDEDEAGGLVESFCVVFECYGDLLTRIIDALDEACDTRLEAVNIAFSRLKARARNTSPSLVAQRNSSGRV